MEAVACRLFSFLQASATEFARMVVTNVVELLPEREASLLALLSLDLHLLQVQSD